MLAQRAFLFASLCAGLAAGCSDPCTELAEKVCECEKTETAQQACLERIDATEPDHTVKDAELDCCSARLEECTCKRLADGDLAACGLAQESDSEPPQACLIPESR
jgi:hypothetical protein